MKRSARVLLWLCTCFLFVDTGAQEVKHAPTVEQCRADQRLWLAQAEGESGSAPLPSYVTLLGWEKEMHECESVDPENQRHYYNVNAELDAENVGRLLRFLDRHRLYDKFIEEDKTGKR